MRLKIRNWGPGKVVNENLLTAKSNIKGEVTKNGNLSTADSNNKREILQVSTFNGFILLITLNEDLPETWAVPASKSILNYSWLHLTSTGVARHVSHSE